MDLKSQRNLIFFRIYLKIGKWRITILKSQREMILKGANIYFYFWHPPKNLFGQWKVREFHSFWCWQPWLTLVTNIYKQTDVYMLHNGKWYLSSVPGCGGILEVGEELRNLTSPGFPTGYQNNLDCVWTITAPAGWHVWANITDINMEAGYRCRYDSLSFYTGQCCLLYCMWALLFHRFHKSAISKC